jgi:hypothetical protein
MATYVDLSRKAVPIDPTRAAGNSIPSTQPGADGYGRGAPTAADLAKPSVTEDPPYADEQDFEPDPGARDNASQAVGQGWIGPTVHPAGGESIPAPPRSGTNPPPDNLQAYIQQSLVQQDRTGKVASRTVGPFNPTGRLGGGLPAGASRTDTPDRLPRNEQPKRG